MTHTERSWAPEACSLPTVERPLREREFAEFFRQELRSARLTAPAHAEFIIGATSRARAEDLITRETSCCSFFDFSLTDDGDRLKMTARVPDRYADVLAALVGSAERQAGVTRS